MLRRSYRTKRLTKQAQVLTKNAVEALERATCRARDPRKRVLAGFFRFCLGSRCRVGDATRIDSEPRLDINPSTSKGYIDATAAITKRSQVKMETMRMGVEITSHSWGLVEAEWAQAWLEARTQCGMDASVQGCLMPSVDADGDFTRCRLTKLQCI